MSGHTPGPWSRAGHRQITSPVGVICEVSCAATGVAEAERNECVIAALPELIDFVARVASAADQDVGPELRNEAVAIIGSIAQ